MEQHNVNGNIGFGVSLSSSFVVWLVENDVDVLFSIGLKFVSIVAALYAIRNYMSSIKYYQSKNKKHE
jgi:hypothetical protein